MPLAFTVSRYTSSMSLRRSRGAWGSSCCQKERAWVPVDRVGCAQDTLPGDGSSPAGDLPGSGEDQGAPRLQPDSQSASETGGFQQRSRRAQPRHPSRAFPSRGDPQPRPDLPVRQSRARVNTTALIFALDLRAEQESWARGAPANPTPAGAEGSPPGPRARGTALSLRVLRSSPGSYQLSLPLLLVPSERPGLRRRYLCRRGSSAEISQRLGPGTRSRRAMWRAGFKDRAAPARSAGLAGAASKQELPAGRASPAKELFTLPVTQIPAGPAALPGPLAAPRDWPPARGQGLFPQGFGRPYPDPSPRPRVCAPSFTGPLTSPPFPAVSPTQRSRELCPCQPSLGTWAK